MGYLEDLPEEHSSPRRQRRTRPLPLSHPNDLLDEEISNRSPKSSYPDPDQVNPGWRNRRKDYRAKRRRSLSSSPQELQLWLQQGGWIVVALIAFLFVAALVALLIHNRSNSSLQSSPPTAPQQNNPFLPGATLTPLPSVTPIPTPAEPAPPLPVERFLVNGTSGYGLFLRDNPSTASNILETLPDGTIVERAGDDTPGAGYVWRKVRAPSGQEGWVAIDFLQPAP